MTATHAGNAALALLNQDVGFATELRSALQAFGANVVYEASLQDIDRVALKASGARMVVINLGDNEDILDDIQDLLENPDYEIIVNDSAVSAALKGPDQARWVRHLAAKILRRPEIVLPPRPAGAVAPPTFEQHWASRVPVAEVIGEPPAPKPAAQAAATTLAAVASPAVDLAQPVPAPLAEAPSLTVEPVSSDDAHLEDALERFDTFAAASAAPAAAVPEQDEVEDADLARALENFDAAAESAASSSPHEDVADLEALLVAVHGSDALKQEGDGTPTGRRAQPEELPDLDLESIDAAIGAVDVSTQEHAAPVPAKPAPPPAKPAVAAPNWSLAPADAPERSTVAQIAKEFGIEKVPAAVYLTPQIDVPPDEVVDPKKVAESLPRGFASLDLELEPIETEEDTKPKNTVAYDTGRDLELPTQAAKPPKREDDASKTKDS